MRKPPAGVFRHPHSVNPPAAAPPWLVADSRPSVRRSPTRRTWPRRRPASGPAPPRKWVDAAISGAGCRHPKSPAFGTVRLLAIGQRLGRLLEGNDLPPCPERTPHHHRQRPPPLRCPPARQGRARRADRAADPRREPAPTPTGRASTPSPASITPKASPAPWATSPPPSSSNNPDRKATPLYGPAFRGKPNSPRISRAVPASRGARGFPGRAVATGRRSPGGRSPAG